MSASGLEIGGLAVSIRSEAPLDSVIGVVLELMGLAEAECNVAKSRDPLDFPSPLYKGCIKSMRPSKKPVLTDSKQKLLVGLAHGAE